MTSYQKLNFEFGNQRGFEKQYLEEQEQLII